MELKTFNRVIDRIQIRVTEEERKKIQENADKYAKGSLSEWLRYAGQFLKPLEKDIKK